MRLFELGIASLLTLCLGGCPAVDKTHVDSTPDHAVVAAPAPAPRLLSVDVAPVERVVKAGAGTELMARIRIQVDELETATRPPLHVALAVDTSGSMAGDAIEHARKACIAMVDALRDGDRIAVVSFDTRAEVAVPSTVLDAKSRKDVRARLEKLQARGTTDMAGGLSAALQQVRGFRDAQSTPRIVLLGDGVPNDPAPLTALADQARQEGIAITSLGLGLDYDETLMGQVAQRSGGSFHYIAESTQVAKVFEDEVLRIERVVGHGATLVLAAGPGVTVHEVVGHVVASGAQTQIPLGDIVAGETRDIVVRLSAPGRASDAVIELLDAEIVYQDAVASGETIRERGFASVTASADADALRGGHDAEVELSAARASVAALILQVIATARAGNLAEAERLADRAEKLARERGRELSDGALAGKAAEVAKLKKSLASLVPARVVVPVGMPSNVPPSPAAPADARAVREAHSAAVRTLQGG